MNQILLMLGAATIMGAAVAYQGINNREEDERAFPTQMRASEADLLRWNAQGCDTDEDCAAMSRWMQARYYFDCEG